MVFKIIKILFIFIILTNISFSQNIVNEYSPISFMSPLIHGNLKIEDTLSTYKNFFSISNNLGNYQSSNILANNYSLNNKYGIGYYSLFNNNYIYYNLINNENNTDTTISIGKKNIIDNDRKISLEINKDYLYLKNLLNSNNNIFYIQKYDTMYIKTTYLDGSFLKSSTFKIYKNYIGFKEHNKNNLNLGYDEYGNCYLGNNSVNNFANFQNNTIIGTNSNVYGHYYYGSQKNMSIGYNNYLNNVKNNNIIIGSENYIQESNDNISIGDNNNLGYYTYNNISLGNNNYVRFNNNINIGNEINSFADNSIIIGKNIYSGYGKNKIIISNSNSFDFNGYDYILIGDSNQVHSNNAIVLGKKNNNDAYSNHATLIGQNNYISSGSYNSILGYNNSVNDAIYHVKIIGDSNYVYTYSKNSIILGNNFNGLAQNSFIVNFKDGMLIYGKVDEADKQFNKIDLYGSVGTLGEKKNIKYINDDYTIEYNDNYLVIDCTNYDINLYLPNLTTYDFGKMYCIKKIDNTNHKVIINTYNSYEKIDDFSNTYEISIKNDYIRIIYFNYNWYIF